MWGAGNTRGLQHSLADVVAYASAGERLVAGTVIGLGTYWVAFPSPRLSLVDRMMPHPAPRRVAVRLPDRLQPAAQRYGLVVRLGADGQITQSLHGPSGSYREIVGVRQHDGWLYLGSLYETAVGRVPVPAVT